ncbi:hypothetical protein RFUL19S_01627 [Rhizobacter fulvus]|jgi:hypothetical protein
MRAHRVAESFQIAQTGIADKIDWTPKVARHFNDRECKMPQCLEARTSQDF